MKVIKMLMTFFIVLCVFAFSISCYAQSSKQEPVVPRATPPGMPVVGMLEQHTSVGGFDTFTKVDAIWDDKGDIARYYFKNTGVKNDIANCIITVWFLEEYTPYGREKFNMKNVTYQYYKLSIHYCDGWGVEIQDEFEWMWSNGTGEVCDSNKKVLSLIAEDNRTRKLDIGAQMQFIKAAIELQRRFNLKGK